MASLISIVGQAPYRRHDMATVQDVRRSNLRRLVSEYEGMTNLAHKLGLTKGAYISQLLTDPPVRSVSEKTARKWEAQLKLPEGWLDGQPKAQGAPPPVNVALLAQSMAAVDEGGPLAGADRGAGGHAVCGCRQERRGGYRPPADDSRAPQALARAAKTKAARVAAFFLPSGKSNR